MTGVDGGYFDGRSARRHPVRLGAGPAGLEVAGEGWRRCEPRGAIEISEPIGGAPRTLRFRDGSYCEVPQGDALDSLLAALGHRDGRVVRWQSSWRVALAALAIMVVAVAAGYRWGLPWLAAEAAPRVPAALVRHLSEGALEMLDRGPLAPSTLAPERQAELDAQFRRFAAADPAVGQVELVFRHGGKLGANAFALPDGKVVLLDEMVKLADEDGQVLAVLGHELGHVRYRHGLRQLLQSSVVAVVAASYFGDLSSLLTGLTTLVLDSNYSRSFELEADDYGASMLAANGYRPEVLAGVLLKLGLAHAERPGQDSLSWLSSHPETEERIARLKGR